MNARDIMTTEVITVKPDERLENVARLMVERKISGVPVVDDNDRLVGIVSEKDLMVKSRDLKIPFFVTLFDSVIFLENPARFTEDLRKFTGVKVGDIMTTKVFSVKDDADITEIANLMTRKNINRVPVVNNNKLVGIISRNDVLKTLVG